MTPTRVCAQPRRPVRRSFQRPSRQRGAATLFVALSVLLLLTVAVFFVNRSLLFGMKASSNQYRSMQAFEAAEAGLEQGIAWLQVRGGTFDDENAGCSASQPVPIRRAVWGCRAGATSSACAADQFEWIVIGDACNAGVPTITGLTLRRPDGEIDNVFGVSVEFRRRKGSIPDLYRIEVLATAQSADGPLSLYSSSATVAQLMVVKPMLRSVPPANPDAPLLVRSSIESVTGTPDLCPRAPTETEINQGNRADCTAGTGATGVAIATMAPDTSGIDPGMFNLHGGGVVPLNAPSTTVHEVLFPGITEAQVRTVSEWQYANLDVADRTVFYYGAGSSYSLPNKLNPVGSPGVPVILYISGSAYSGANACPGLSPGEYFGLLYIGAECNGNGWGNADVYGSIAIDGALSQFTANTIARFFDIDKVLGTNYGMSAGTVARVPGSWRDF